MARRRVLALIAGATLAAAGIAGWQLLSSEGADGMPSARELFDRGELHFELADWRTDFSRRTVPLTEFEGGPPRDGIPPIDRPRAVSQDRAERFLAPDEPLMVVEVRSAIRAYPLQILVWHEIVNDVLGGRPLAVTYCPLCNSGIVLDRRLRDRVLDFGTTGTVRHADLVMYDRQTQSWWQQITGEAVVGKLAGEQLRHLPSSILSWREFKRAHPGGDVLSRDTGHERPYGKSPYSGYEDFDEPTLFHAKEPDRRLPPKERVLAVFSGGEAAVVPFSLLRRKPVFNGAAGGTPFVAAFREGVRSPLDRNHIAQSRRVGTATAFDRRVAGRALRFERRGGLMVDDATQSTWNPASGRAVRGQLRGRRLRPLRHDQQFWFALAAFLPDAQILR